MSENFFVGWRTTDVTRSVGLLVRKFCTTVSSLSLKLPLMSKTSQDRRNRCNFASFAHLMVTERTIYRLATPERTPVFTVRENWRRRRADVYSCVAAQPQQIEGHAG